MPQTRNRAPRARSSASVRRQISKLKSQIGQLRAQVDSISKQQGPQGPPGPPGPPGERRDQGAPGNTTGPAGGDLTGTYPDPQIAAEPSPAPRSSTRR